MKLSEHTTREGTRTTPADVGRWARELWQLHRRIAPRFVRSEPRGRVLHYLQGIISEIPRKNGWQLAEYAGEARPDGMQRLLSSAVWDADGVRDDVRAYVLSQLGTVGAILVLDETSFKKRGKKSAGVARQYCGETKRRENCQVGVFLSYVTASGHTLVDRELYIPQRWFADQERCRQAGIPESRCFQTKCELARRMVERIVQAHVAIRWVVADTVYGSNQDLRDDLEGQGLFYVLAVRCTQPIELQTQAQRRRMTVEEAGTRLLQRQEWHRLSMGEGTKGPRLFDLAAVPMLHRCQDDRQHWLLMRRSLSDPTDIQYYFVFAPERTRLAEMVEAIGARWKIEEDFEAGKDLGLDQYEVRSFTGRSRHITLVMLVLALLTGICAQDQAVRMQEQDRKAPEPPRLSLTRPEVAHLLGHLIWPHPHQVPFLLAWSWWRRCHRSRASACHTKRRLKAG